MQTKHIRITMSIVTSAFLFLIFCVSIASSESEGASPRIVGGNTAVPGQFPYQVSLRMRDVHFCGGSIISSSRILTAAHCVDGFRSSDIDAVVGIINKSGYKHQTNRIRMHPNYDSRNMISDIATLDTLRTISFNTYVQPIGLARSPPSPGTRVTASGWGLLQYQGSRPDKLQYVDLTILDVKNCASIFQRERFAVNDRHVCTTSPKGKGICFGD